MSKIPTAFRILALGGVFLWSEGMASVVANTTEFSGTQGQDNWYYGFHAGVGGSYTVGAFQQFASTAFNGSYWDPAPNPNYLTIQQSTWHPNGGSGTGAVQSPIKRWIAEGSGIVTASGQWRNNDTARSASALSRNGTYARIFVEGVQVYSQYISWWAYPDYANYSVDFEVDAGDRVDFMIDYNGDVNDDLTYWTAELDLQVPEPSGFLMALASVGGLLLRRRR